VPRLPTQLRATGPCGLARGGRFGLAYSRIGPTRSQRSVKPYGSAESAWSYRYSWHLSEHVCTAVPVPTFSAILQPLSLSRPASVLPDVMSHWVLLCNRIDRAGIPYVAKGVTLEKCTLEKCFDFCTENPYDFLLITNQPDGRPRGRVNGWRGVRGLL
jgi:hypothetical protein